MTPTPHDALFKRIFANRDDAIGELRSILPPELLAAIDIEQLEVLDRSFIDPELVSRQTDCLYAVPVARRRGLVYVLFEHKSQSGRFVILSLLGYMLRIWEAHLRDNPGCRELPPIIPVLLQHDETGFRAALTMHDLFAPDLMSIPAFAELTPSFNVVVDDLMRTTDDELRARQMSTFARIGLWALRDGRSDRLLRTVRSFMDLLDELVDTPRGRVDAQTVLLYLFLVQGRATYEAFAAMTSKRVRETAMTTIAEQLREEGRQEGRLEGRLEGELQGRRALIHRLIVRRFGETTPAVEATLEQADLDELDRLAERVLTATNIEDLL